VLWQKEPPLPAFSLGAALRIFEKLLSGIEDGEIVAHGDHAHDGIEMNIADAHRLFDPWTTRRDFLAYLASWGALEFPGIWDEYQRRKITSEIVSIYIRRGLKDGLNQYLELYTVSATRPRIAVDDGSKLVSVEPKRERFSPVNTVISQEPFGRGSRTLHEGLIRPQGMTAAPDGSLIVADVGTLLSAPYLVAPGVWRVRATGDYQFEGAPPKPRRLGPLPATWTLRFPIAVVVDKASPWSVFVLDSVAQAGAPALYKLTSPAFSTATTLATRSQLGYVTPLDMVLDTNGHLLILDRGAGLLNPAIPRIIDVDVQATTLAVTSVPLTSVIEPVSLILRSNGDLIVGDARSQAPVAAADFPADLVRVDRMNAANWVETRLLSAVPIAQNPLLAPLALAEESVNVLYVADAGLKRYTPDPARPFLRAAAEPAAAYRIDLGQTIPTVTRASDTGQIVYPTGMVLRDGSLFICDGGEPEVTATPRMWRGLPHEFGVVVHFSDQRPTSISQRRQLVGNVREIALGQKPAHTLLSVYSAI
jgi:phage tail-like protein